MRDSIEIACETKRTPAVEAALDILERTIQERTRTQVTHGTQGMDGGAYRVALDIRDGIGAEGFEIETSADRVSIVGNDERGLLSGVGKFLRASTFGDEGFVPGAWSGVSVPVKSVRAMYFATHFHNFYHDAPVAEVERYVEELALWGCNALSVWFDMHHFDGMDDPRAVAMVERLRTILGAANRVGMGGALTTLGNEGFATSPPALRADWTAGHDGYHRAPGGHYHVEICPSKPGGLETILEYRRQVFDAFADLQMDYVWIWPYDQGGCTCGECAPWGANGFLEVAEAEAGLIRQYWPSAKVVFSTWYYDRFVDGEWEGLDKSFSEQKPDWVDVVLADDYAGFPQYPLTHGIPGGFPAVGFPEISMNKMRPWGGFGANPRPGYWQQHWDRTRDLLDGSFPYSEGIYEDINKVLMLQLEWEPDRRASDILREYAVYEYSPAVADAVVEAIGMLEDGMDHSVDPDVLETLWEQAAHDESTGDGRSAAGPDAGGLYRLEAATDSKACLDLLRAADAELSDYAKRSWRWRILLVRAELDAELTRSGGAVTERSEALFGELVCIYRADRAETPVAPPSTSTLKRLAGK